MPVYDYRCDVHGVFEVQQSIKDPPLDRCPQCVKEGRSEYYCETCKVIHGALPEWTEGGESVECNVCGNKLIPWPKPKKLISLSSFVLKGGGWANEGYK